MTTILVTGGAGYIGSHACKALALAGYEPVAFDNLTQGHRSAVRWGPLVEADILDPAALTAACRRFAPRAVMHFAGLASVAESVADPGRYERINVDGSINLLKAMCQAGIPHMVFSSSAAVYGNPQARAMPEHHPLAPVNPYGANKLHVERLLRQYEASHGLRSVALRYFNAAGADPQGETGEDHTPETHLVPLALAAAAGRRDSVTILGDKHATPDGTCERDYVHVSDLAQAHVLALQWLEDGGASGAFNLGLGRGISVREVITVAREVTGRDFEVKVGAARAGDPPRLVADASLARATLGWTPRWVELPDIVASAWAWHSARWQ